MSYTLRTSPCLSRVNNFSMTAFMVSCCLFYGAVSTMPQQALNLMNSCTVRTIMDLLGALRMPLSVNGSYLSLDHFSVVLTRECSVIYLGMPYLSFLLAFPSTMRDKAVGIFFGAAALFCLNSLRISLILIAGTMSPVLAETMHLYLGQLTMVIAVLCLCLFWIKSTVSGRSSDPDMQFLKSVIIFTGILFPVWACLKAGYASALQSVLLFLMESTGVRSDMLAHVSVNQGLSTTMNLITFSALMCASGSLKTRSRIFTSAAGLAVLSFVHLMHAGLELFLIGNHYLRPNAAMNVFLLLVQVLLPFVLWRFFVLTDFLFIPNQKKTFMK